MSPKGLYPLKGVSIQLSLVRWPDVGQNRAMTPTMTIRQAAAIEPTWDHLYALVFGWGWEELAHQADPFDPTDDGRFLAERDVMPECEHPDATWDRIDDVLRCTECDQPI